MSGPVISTAGEARAPLTLEPAALCVRGLSKHFGGLVVADGIDLTIRPGECHAVIGPNGAGKTTLVNQISGLIASDNGTIELAGVDLTDKTPDERARLGLARTFQISSVIGSMSAGENVALALRASARTVSGLFPDGRNKAFSTHAALILARIGLEGVTDRMAADLSHGERRALEIAVALALDPTILILDEPLAGMGRDESHAMTELLMTLKGHHAMLLIEHDMDAVFALADVVSVLVAGKVVASGSPEAIRANPLVRAVYLGEDHSV